MRKAFVPTLRVPKRTTTAYRRVRANADVPSGSSTHRDSQYQPNDESDVTPHGI